MFLLSRHQVALVTVLMSMNEQYLQHHAVVCWSLVLALIVLAMVDINMVQLEKTHQVSGCLQTHKH